MNATQTTGVSTKPFHQSIAAMIAGLNPAINDNVVQAQTLKQLLETTTVPSNHFDEVRETIDGKLAELKDKTDFVATSLAAELVGMQNALDKQVAAHGGRQNGGKHVETDDEIDPAVAAAKTGDGTLARPYATQQA